MLLSPRQFVRLCVSIGYPFQEIIESVLEEEAWTFNRRNAERLVFEEVALAEARDHTSMTSQLGSMPKLSRATGR